IVRSEFGPTDIADSSRNSNCVWPSGPVVMCSLNTTSWPITNLRTVPPGGVPVASALTALLTPTFCWASASDARVSNSTAPRARMRLRNAGFPSMRGLLKPNLGANQHGIARVGVERKVRGHDVALELQEDRDVVGDLNILAHAKAPATVIPGA